MNVVMIAFALWIAPHTDEPGNHAGRWACSSAACCSCCSRLPAVMKLGLFRMAALAPGGRRRAAHRQAHAARHRRLLDGAGEPAARHADRVVPDHRQHRVAVPRRSHHGIPARRVQHRAGHGHPAGPVAASRGSVTRAFHAHARLGAAPGHPAGVARRGRHAGFRRPADAPRSSATAHSTRTTCTWPATRSWPTPGACSASAWSRCSRPGYFARQDTRTPVRVGLIALGVNMAMNIGVVLPAKYLGFPYPHVLLATSTCIVGRRQHDAAVARAREAGCLQAAARAGASCWHASYLPTPSWRRC